MSDQDELNNEAQLDASIHIQSLERELALKDAEIAEWKRRYIALGKIAAKYRK